MTSQDQSSPSTRLEMERSAEESAHIGDHLMMTESKKVSQKSIKSSGSPVYEQASDEFPNLQSATEQRAFQALTEEPFMKRPQFIYNNDMDMADFSSLNFPRKLWKIVESDYFNSLWWDDDGVCVVIDEELFKTEVLERKGPFRIFETDSVKSFIRQLNLYGFTKIRREFQRSASLTEFLAEEKTATAFNKLQLYQNPNFRRDYPHLLGRMKRRVGIKNAFSVMSSLEQDFRGEDIEKCAVETREETVTYSKDNIQKRVPGKPTSQRPSKSTSCVRGIYAASSSSGKNARASEHVTMGQNAELNHLAPSRSRSPVHTCHTHSNCHGTDSTTTTSSTSLYHVIPPIPNNQFNHVMGLPAFPTMYPDLTAMQANLASLLPFCNPWLSMPMMAAAISMSRSFHHRNPSNHQCPNCNCFAENATLPSSSSSTTPPKGSATGQDYKGLPK